MMREEKKKMKDAGQKLLDDLAEEFRPDWWNKGKEDKKKNPKRTSIGKNLRMASWRQHFGNSGEGKCYVCGRTIYIDDFQAGHIIAVAKGGENSVDNIRPICKPCNVGMGTMDLNEYKKKFKS